MGTPAAAANRCACASVCANPRYFRYGLRRLCRKFPDADRLELQHFEDRGQAEGDRKQVGSGTEPPQRLKPGRLYLYRGIGGPIAGCGGGSGLSGQHHVGDDREEPQHHRHHHQGDERLRGAGHLQRLDRPVRRFLHPAAAGAEHAQDACDR